MKQNLTETIVGFAVIFIACFFLIFAYKQNRSDVTEEYMIKAKFENVEGIIKGSDIQIAGIIVGRVLDMKLDPETYSAILTLTLTKDIKIPVDSRASVTSAGLLGGKYISITPGGDDENIKEGGQIKYTQSSMNLEALIGKFMYSGGGGSGTDAATNTPAPSNRAN
ncbi:MAG: outer membrane lipid asymmetry maintenance protein MlaD [Alphaproteobacteria bacterium]|nr:outer membrane lipid asymmetry maintenance protein MlaD [Alphaproteobacteria bacterium]